MPLEHIQQTVNEKDLQLRQLWGALQEIKLHILWKKTDLDNGDEYQRLSPRTLYFI